MSDCLLKRHKLKSTCLQTIYCSHQFTLQDLDISQIFLFGGRAGRKDDLNWSLRNLLFYRRCNLLLQKALQIAVKSKYTYSQTGQQLSIFGSGTNSSSWVHALRHFQLSHLIGNHVHTAITSLSLSSCMFIYYCCCGYCLFCLTNYQIQIHSADFPLKWRNEAHVVHDTWVMCGDDCLHGWKFWVRWFREEIEKDLAPWRGWNYRAVCKSNPFDLLNPHLNHVCFQAAHNLYSSNSN